MYARVYVEITNICNMNCSFCHGHSRKPRRMTVGEFSHVLDQLEGKTNYIYYHLMGEPLTHPDLPQFLQLADERGFRSVITTNGTLLRQRKQDLLSSRVHKISISLHSFEKDDEQAFRQYMHNVTDFAEAAANAGTVIVFRLWNKGCDGGRNLLTEEYLRTHLHGEWAENTKGYRIRKKLFLEWGDRFVWPDQYAPLQDEEVFCYGLRDHFGILCDGTVVPCCLDSDGIIHLGNLHKEELSDILASPRAKALTAGFECRSASEDLCRRCAYARRFV